MNKFNVKSLLAVLLTLAMVCSIVPMFAVSAEEATATKVTDVADLKAGDQIVLVNKAGTKAMGAQSGKYRAETACTSSGDTVTVSDAMAVLTLEAGSAEGSFALKASDGYLYFSGTKNTVHTQDTMDAAASWTITIADGIAKILNVKDAQWYLQHNASSTRFASYKTSSNQANPVIYKLDAAEAPEVPECKHLDTEIVDYKDATETEEGYTGDTVCTECGETVKTGEKIPVKVPETPVVPDAPAGEATYVIADHALPTTAGKFDYQFDNTLSINLTNGVKNGELLRIYANQMLTFNSTKPVSKIVLKASNGASTFYVETSEDGTTWTRSHSDIAFAAAESDIEIAFDTPVQIFRLIPAKQMRLRSFVVTTTEGGDTPDVPECKHTDTEIVDYKDATETEEGYTGDTVCTECGATVKTGEKIPVKTPVTPSIPLTNGMQVVIYVPGYNKALTSEATGNYLKGVTITVADGKVTGYGDSAVWTVIVNEDGTYSFENGGKKIGMQASYASMSMGSVNDKWQVISLGNGLYNIKNTVRGNFMEWYNQYSNWSTYNSSSATTDPQFQIAFFEVVEEEEPACEHKNTKLENAKEATETEEGYTGDTVCTDCGETIKTGEKIPVKTPVTPPATEPDAPVFGVITAPKAGVAYKFGMVQGNLNKTFYLKGGMNGYYMATTESVDEAIDVYLEETDGGFYLYTMVNGVKTYINMVVSGTHVNGAYEATASTVYKWNAEKKTIVAEVNGADYWFGTRNDNTYTTAGPCAVSYNGFYCQFYGVEEVVEPEQPGTDKPAQTGDVTVMLVAVALIAGAALVVVSRKRRFN